MSKTVAFHTRTKPRDAKDAFVDEGPQVPAAVVPVTAAPDARELTPGSPRSASYVSLSFKVSPEFRDLMESLAFHHRTKQVQILQEAVAFWAKNHPPPER